MESRIIKARSRRLKQEKKWEKELVTVRDFISYFIHLITSNRTLLIVLALILMFAVGKAAEVTNNMPAKKDDTNKHKDDLIKHACRQKFPTLNKPSNVTFTLTKDLKDIPVSCVADQTTPQCQNDMMRSKSAELFYSHYASSIKAMRAEVKRKLTEYYNKLGTKAGTVQTQLPASVRSEFAAQIDKLLRAKQTALYTEGAKALGGGFCEEHGRASMHELLQINAQQNLGLFINHIMLKRTNPQTSKVENSHVFILITDTELTTEVVKGFGAVKNKLREFKKYLMCDSWNDLEVTELELADSAYNNAKGKWDIMEIEDMTVHPEHISKLPEDSEARKMVCEEAQAANLLPENFEPCRMFQPKKEENTQALETEKRLVQ